jgi:hypothetical protein
MSAHSMLPTQEQMIMPDQRKTRHDAGEAPAAQIHFGREICGDLAAAEKREWLVTNGIGGFASGTVAGLQTRRYHGLPGIQARPCHGL